MLYMLIVEPRLTVVRNEPRSPEKIEERSNEHTQNKLLLSSMFGLCSDHGSACSTSRRRRKKEFISSFVLELSCWLRATVCQREKHRERDGWLLGEDCGAAGVKKWSEAAVGEGYLTCRESG